MADPRVLKGVAYVLLLVAAALLAVALFTDGNNMWTALAAVFPALAATSLFVRADPDRYRKKNKAA